MKRPDSSEYANYYGGYVGLITEDDIVAVFRQQADEMLALADLIPAEKGGFAYADGKWTVKELLGHIIDAERMFAYRMHRFSHGDALPLTGFDQDIYINNGRYAERDIESLLKEFVFQRHANILMLAAFRESDWDLKGTASEAEVTVRALAFIMAGHVRHHVNILKERYLS